MKPGVDDKKEGGETGEAEYVAENLTDNAADKIVGVLEARRGGDVGEGDLGKGRARGDEEKEWKQEEKEELFGGR